MDSHADSEKPLGIDDVCNLVGDLRQVARQLLDVESHNHTLTPTALAMTALRRVKLADQEWNEVRWENRRHFFSAITRAMRHALVDYARHRRARGRDRLVYLPPEEGLFRDLPDDLEKRPAHLEILDDTLKRLSEVDAELADVLHQHYLMGYSIPEIARFSEVVEKTVDRRLQRARTLAKKLYLQQPARE